MVVVRARVLLCASILVVAGCSDGASEGSMRVATVLPPAVVNAPMPASTVPTPSSNPALLPPPVDMQGNAGAPAPAPAIPAETPADPNADQGADWIWTPTGLPDVEFSMAVKIPAGGEMFKCQYFAFPTDRGVIAVPAVESHYAQGSHHLIAYRTNLTSIPLTQTGQFDCFGGFAGLSERGSYYEAQQPDSHRELPAGVAHEFQPGEVILMESHYLNVTAQDIDGEVRLVMHTMDVAAVQQEAGTIMFNNLLISIPPRSKTRVTRTCPIPEDFIPALLWSHMHHWGTYFIATTDDPQAVGALGILYEETEWSEPQPRAYPSDPPITLHAGSHITFSCEYQNDGDTTITFGVSAEKNEMCLLHGMYWPRMTTAGAEQCRGGVAMTTAIP